MDESGKTCNANFDNWLDNCMLLITSHRPYCRTPANVHLHLHLWFTRCPSLLTVIARGLRLKKRKREESIGKLEAKKRHDRKVRRI